jgi:hypothetical protein
MEYASSVLVMLKPTVDHDIAVIVVQTLGLPLDHSLRGFHIKVLCIPNAVKLSCSQNMLLLALQVGKLIFCYLFNEDSVRIATATVGMEMK